MSFTYLKDRSVYEERYDKTTVALCCDGEEMVEKMLGKRPPLDARGEADSASGYYPYSVIYFGLVEAVAGRRWQQREATIKEWMAEDEAKDRRLAEARPATLPYCRSCGETMQLTRKHYYPREHAKSNEPDDILFMFDCKACKNRMATFQDGTEWRPPQPHCVQCNAPVTETDQRRGNVITTTYTCAACGHAHKSTLRLGGHPKPTPDPLFKLDRRRFCFDVATGQKFLARKAHIERLQGLLEYGRPQAGGAPVFDPVATAAKSVKRLKVAQVADLLAKAVADADYTAFKLGELQTGPELAFPFSCLDAAAEREDYDSRTQLKKLITTTLADTNWQLMSEGISHRVGYLSGRLRAYESDDDLRQLVQRRAKAGTITLPTSPPSLPAEEPARAKPAPPPKPKRGRRERNIRVRGVLHHNLHILIPPRETPAPKRNSPAQSKTDSQS